MSAQQSRPITPQGFRRLQEELQTLWHEERPRVVQEVSDAAALGDRSENAEYIYGKRRLREIDRRIRFLSECLESVQVVDPSANSSDQVRFGAVVRVEDENAQTRSFQIVGEDEIEAKKGRISIRSPIGRALLNRRVGDSVSVKRPAGPIEMEILEISYGS